MRSGPRLAAVVGAVSAVMPLGSCADTATETELARGAELYGMHCASCHGGATSGDISDVPPPHNAEGHTWHHPDSQLMDIVLDGMPQREGFPAMPAFGDRLDDEDVDAILAHIKTWWEPDQLEFQAEITEQLCNNGLPTLDG